MIGLCLQGGGAKGAFQAGAIYALNEVGVNINIVSGTSIGAINSYFIYANKFDKMKNLWLNTDESNFKNSVTYEKTIDNSYIIGNLPKFEKTNKNIKSVFINYVEVSNYNLIERYEDITKLDVTKAIETIKYSSLLPAPKGDVRSQDDLYKNFDSRELFEEFFLDVKKGGYDGFNLDGGLMCNTFLKPFLNNHVEKLYIIVFKNNYKIPEYLLKEYTEDKIIVIKPDFSFEPSDTLRFERDFCEQLFWKGYEIVKLM
ncbi:patatin-like phospholipase family protein [Abyssisolibacter fermentans]|uniref:patatin-like phospholipase family protein n=1 Tax=Abyssisolibacter fermentans TaxID=1766203 RepID=UPI000835E7FC|nr:patatin-like phospholipase family protein [Abyssisolibacter fermentans]